ncbi:T9SS type A sorting domain-containing protein [Kaistella sp. PBT33-4]|uniref:T9SS type A sorting domain-containing protein n=1 Tax=Kaistella sp. PBT33-4 TaxID=3032000 RepID=UPI0023D8A7B7|nr:T9SS type A sorting domain-containing protein [Kaistella sp. PBT33-4]MDF0718703.1 T9SS type A sorting domain-containing protein [Kaistella sp. PBT33-4]
MKNKLYLLLLTTLTTLASAQTYSWQWAKYGGGNTGSTSSGFNYTQDESIRDIAVDNQNNYYYLATMNPTNPTLNGTAVDNYDRQDLFLFSTDCQGNVRWTRNIGGTTAVQQSWNIEVDNNGGLYIMGTFQNRAYASNPTYAPLHFDSANHIPVIQISQTDTTTPDPGLKTAYLLKYSTANGNLEWQKPLQGNVTSALRSSDCGIFYMDSSKNIHAIVGFAAGTHLNGAITVPASFTGSYQYYLIKFSYNNGNMTPDPNPLLLPITGFIVQGYSEGKVSLLYDGTAGVNQYYLAGKRMQYGNFTYSDFSYGGTPFTEDGYLLAFNGTTGAEVWRKEFTMSTNPANVPDDNSVLDVVKDPNTSDIYIAGNYYIYNQNGSVVFNNSVSFGNYTFPYVFQGYNPYVMKLNPAGTVLWATIPSAISANSIEGYKFMKGRLTLNNNEVAFVKGSRGDTWGSFAMQRPVNDQADPLLVRLNTGTGAVIGTHEVLSSFGSQDEFTAVAVDNDGNYVLGGFMHGILFEDPNDGLPSMNGLTGSGKSQFFVSKLAKSACSAMATAETPVQQTDVAFYPNPVQDVLNIKTKEKLLSYEVITADGRLITQGKFARTYTVDMTGMTTGVYYVKVLGEGFATTGKVIKK